MAAKNVVSFYPL